MNRKPIKIRNLYRAIVAASVILIFGSCVTNSQDAPSFRAIEKGFRSIPDSVQLGVYWYWISDNISKEAVVKDLESMKAVGINRAFIGNIGIDGIPYGDIKVLSPEWWEVLHTALKKATELDIEIGIFNSPGWSQSGGPWVKSQESMRYLASSEMAVQGPQTIKTILPEVGKNAQDVRIIAYPSLNACASKTWNVEKKNGQKLVLDMPLDSLTTIRSFSYTTQTPIRTEAELFVKEGSSFRLLKRIMIDRSNPALNVGFNPFAPIVISIPEIKSSAFRLEIMPSGEGKAEVTLSAQPKMERYPEKSLAKMFQTPLPMWHDYLWSEQPDVTNTDLVINPKNVVDLTANMNESGMLEWEVPEGDWIISRTAMLSTGVTNGPAAPEATGLEIDKMSQEHVSTHFDAFIGEILRRIPEADRKSFKVVVQDSYETGGQNWTDDMIERFDERYGYSPIPYLPVLEGKIVSSPDQSDRFLWDLRRLVADRVAYDYVGGLRKVSHQHGLTTWLENYGHWGFPGEFLQYGGQSDEISGEFWSEGSLGDIENRAASSCAHIYGKKKVWAESFTSGGPVFSRYPYMMKQRGDRFFTEGINNTLLHVYIQQPFEDKEPGLDAWFGNEFNRKNTWFNQMDVFIQYLKRCNFMLQQGTYVADVAYFIGEDAPKMTGVCNPELPKGYSFDYINAEVLLTRASAKDGKLYLPDGMQYRVLVLPQLQTMRPEVLRKIKDLVQEGVVILGSAPSKSPSLSGYPEADTDIQELADELWGKDSEKNRAYGKGFVFSSENSLTEVFDKLDMIPDFNLGTNEKSSVLFIHRTVPEGEIYFISNQQEKTIKINPEFRVSGKQPELWNPLTAETRMLLQNTQSDRTTMIPIELQANESAFVIFRNEAKVNKLSKANYPEKEVVSTLSSPWQVSFEKGKRGPDEKVTFTSLQDWTQSDDERIKYFSGNAVYSTSFTLDKTLDKELYLDLGKVMVTAKVKLNDQYIGGVWTMPYRLNITDYIRSGENKLEVEVANNWMNRLIGDQHLPEPERGTWTNINPWRADSPLQSSGLIGPVEIQAYDYEVFD